MVTAKAAVTPSNPKVIEEASPEYTSLVNIHEEGDEYVAVRKARSKSHQRHTSLFSNASAPVDLSDYPSMRRAPSSKAESVLRKSISGNLNWKFGELWSKFRGSSLKPNDLRSTSLTINDISEAPTQTVAAAQVETGGAETLGFQNRDVGKPPSSPKEWKKEKDQEEIVSPTSRSKSLHFTSLGLFSSSKFSSSGGLDTSASSLERSGQLESSHESTANHLSGKWRDIQGTNRWSGLMDPLDLDLRKEILRYGDFAQLAYDNFECNTHSKYAGSARHSKQEVLSKLNKQGCGYEVTRFLYATSERPLPGVLQSSLSSEHWDKDSNWMGYVAVASDPEEIKRLGRRDIVVAWRGAVKTVEWLVDAQTQMTPVTVGNSNVTETVQHPRVEKGFWSLYNCKRPASQFNRKSASEQVIMELRRLLALYKGENLSITLTGHNLGGVLAVLTAYEIAERGLHKQGDNNTVVVTAFTFGAPHVGNGAFRRRCEELQLRVLRVVNVHDVVPKSIANFYPPLWGSSDASKHVGVELQVNHKLSPYLKSSLKDPLDWHNLECYLHLVDGYEGPKAKKAKGFELVTHRDVALVNKYADVLQERFCTPARWWQAEKKGLALSREGRWVEANRAPAEIPSLANHESFL